MEQLRRSCDNYNLYPRNLVGQNVSLQRVDACRERLQSEETRLFAERRPKVNVLDVSDNKEGFQRKVASSLDDIKSILPTALSNDVYIPRCRFIFVHAAHSRAPLRISRDMLAFICSYYQIPPSFLDFVFPFGKQEHDQHNDVCVLRNESRLHTKQRGLAITSLGRSGCDVRLSYHLQSVERSPNQVSLAWSIRQTAVYHSYDLLTRYALWINVKGNQQLENIVDAEPMLTDSSVAPVMSSFPDTLATHMVFAEWAGQNWREYINELESLVLHATERTIFVPVNHSHPTVHTHSRSSTLVTSEKSRSSLEPAIAISGESPHGKELRKQPPELPSVTDRTMTDASFGSEESRFLDDFSFSDLQDVQSTEERIDQAVMVLSLNLKTLNDLRHLYRSLVERRDVLEDITADDVDIFETQVIAIEKDLDSQVVRSRTLLRKIQERKALLNSILQYRSMKASEFFASKAQQSTDSMERLTTDMHTIAMATKKETVSMHIVTLVTLFFLPGTFVATFLSTDVLRWTNDHREFAPEALTTYLAISLPLMALTFSAWFFTYKYAARKEALVTKLQLFPVA